MIFIRYSTCFLILNTVKHIQIRGNGENEIEAKAISFFLKRNHDWKLLIFKKMNEIPFKCTVVYKWRETWFEITPTVSWN